MVKNEKMSWKSWSQIISYNSKKYMNFFKKRRFLHPVSSEYKFKDHKNNCNQIWF